MRSFVLEFIYKLRFFIRVSEMFIPIPLKHLIHCCGLITVVSWLTLMLVSLAVTPVTEEKMSSYGILSYILLFSIRLIPLLALPHIILHCIGLLFFDSFCDKIVRKRSSLLTPLICFRVVTRGCFPQLVRDNVVRNMACCCKVGLENFLIEVVTDKAIGLPTDPRVREVVVPPEYRPKNGTLYKARALQYCLEDDVNILTDEEYIVHLDEETVITENAINGIINFVHEGKYDFGQGLITYTNDKIVNWITTLCDNIRVADDMGKLRAQFRLFHKPIMNWKGSYIVSKVSTFASYSRHSLLYVNSVYIFCRLKQNETFHSITAPRAP